LKKNRADAIRRARQSIKKNRTNRRTLGISAQGIKDSMLILKYAPEYALYQFKRCSRARVNREIEGRCFLSTGPSMINLTREPLNAIIPRNLAFCGTIATCSE
jgi:hypothetical protein